MTNNKYIDNFVNIANLYVNLGYWPSYFKKSTLIIIPKPNKPVYNFLISENICLIILNKLGKLIEKVISKRLQIHSITSNFVHPNQLKGLRYPFTLNMELYLAYLIYTG